jgi:hypothetical protein
MSTKLRQKTESKSKGETTLMAKRSSKDLAAGGDFKPTAMVDIKKIPKDKTHVTFVGKLVEARKVVTTKYGQKAVYGFAAVDGDALFLLKGVETDIAQGDTVNLWPSDGIDQKLQKLAVELGETVTFVSRGLKVNAT